MGHGKESWVEASHLFDLRNVCEIFGGPVIKGACWRGPVSPRNVSAFLSLWPQVSAGSSPGSLALL